ncbi:ATP synthase subunit I [Atribacter laminatus]|jgi:hypothetical protein|uniref:Uncharacterized protein n=1 Tax=Atribacter laminatus TaxID=2847778 RepID=A0A7T1F3Y1_ATRLM|nr:ATP synthase subunit I [Atribacter laminatus]QPM68860.1 hypothetical protein RT761_02086 [Atribacter laminatus]
MNTIIKAIISILLGAGLSTFVAWLVAWNVKKLIYFKKYQPFTGLIGRLATTGVFIIFILKYIKPDILMFFLGFFITYFLTVWIISIKFF